MRLGVQVLLAISALVCVQGLLKAGKRCPDWCFKKDEDGNRVFLKDQTWISHQVAKLVQDSDSDESVVLHATPDGDKPCGQMDECVQPVSLSAQIAPPTAQQSDAIKQQLWTMALNGIPQAFVSEWNMQGQHVNLLSDPIPVMQVQDPNPPAQIPLPIAHQSDAIKQKMWTMVHNGIPQALASEINFQYQPVDQGGVRQLSNSNHLDVLNSKNQMEQQDQDGLNLVSKTNHVQEGLFHVDQSLKEEFKRIVNKDNFKACNEYGAQRWKPRHKGVPAQCKEWTEAICTAQGKGCFNWCQNKCFDYCALIASKTFIMRTPEENRYHAKNCNEPVAQEEAEKKYHSDRILVRGMGTLTNTEIKMHFKKKNILGQKLGIVTDVTRPISAGSEKFGFVSFKNPKAVDKILADYQSKDIDINGINVTVERAVHTEFKKKFSVYKIWVGGLDHETTAKELRTYFGQFGTVLFVTMRHGPKTNKSQSFAFVSFLEPTAADKVLAKDKANPGSIGIKEGFHWAVRAANHKDPARNDWYFNQ